MLLVRVLLCAQLDDFGAVRVDVVSECSTQTEVSQLHVFDVDFSRRSCADALHLAQRKHREALRRIAGSVKALCLVRSLSAAATIAAQTLDERVRVKLTVWTQVAQHRRCVQDTVAA